MLVAVDHGIQVSGSQPGNSRQKGFLHEALMSVSKLFQLLNIAASHLLHHTHTQSSTLLAIQNVKSVAKS